MLFGLVLLYMVLFYSQIGERVPALAPLRLELIVGTTIMAALVPRGLQWLSHPRARSRLGPAVLLFFGAILVSMPGSYWKQASLETFLLIAKYFAVYLMIVSVVDTEARLRTFMWVYLLMVLLIVGEPFYGVLTGKAVFETHRGYDRLTGPSSLWAHPNSLGGFAAANLPFLYFLFRAERSWRSKAILGVTAVAALGTVVYTGSRSASLGVVGAALGIWWYSERRGRSLLALGACLALLWAVMPEPYQRQLLTLGQADEVIAGEVRRVDSSMVARWEIIRDAYRIFLDHPVTGVGLGAFQTARGERFNRWQHTHNLYLQILAELGLIGAAAFGLLTWRIFGTARAARKLAETEEPQAPWLDALARGITGFLVARLVLGLFGMDLYENYWWLAAGLSVAVWRLANERAVHVRERADSERGPSPTTGLAADAGGRALARTG